MAGKGNPKGIGRPVGTPNKATADARKAIAEFVDGNAGRLQGWLDQIAEGVLVRDNDGLVILDKDQKPVYLTQPNPQKAFELFQSVVEYHVPKLARQEITGPAGGNLIVQIVSLADNSPPALPAPDNDG